MQGAEALRLGVLTCALPPAADSRVVGEVVAGDRTGGCRATPGLLRAATGSQRRPGLEVSGVIAEVGAGVTDWKRGPIALLWPIDAVVTDEEDEVDELDAIRRAGIVGSRVTPPPSCELTVNSSMTLKGQCYEHDSAMCADSRCLPGPWMQPRLTVARNRCGGHVQRRTGWLGG